MLFIVILLSDISKAEAASDEEKIGELTKKLEEEIDKGTNILVDEELENYFSERSGLGSLKDFIKGVTEGEGVAVTEIFSYFSDSPGKISTVPFGFCTLI